MFRAYFPVLMLFGFVAINAVAIIAISALFTNTSRAFAFWNVIDWRRAAIIVACSSSTDVTDPPTGNCRIPSSVPSTAVVVLIKDFAYVPELATVPRGGQVAWVNKW